MSVVGAEQKKGKKINTFESRKRSGRPVIISATIVKRPLIEGGLTSRVIARRPRFILCIHK